MIFGIKGLKISTRGTMPVQHIVPPFKVKVQDILEAIDKGEESVKSYGCSNIVEIRDLLKNKQLKRYMVKHHPEALI